MPTSTDRAGAELDRLLRKAPARVANASRNARTSRDRRRRWAPARDALWDFVAPDLSEGARVAIVGAGNGDDLPLRRIAERAAEVVLIDLDPRAVAGARRRLKRAERRKVEVIGHDVTAGAADQIALTAPRSEPPVDPLPGSPYDLVIGDLFYSQLLYPALRDLGVDGDRIDATIAAQAPSLTCAVVARLQASAPLVFHVHDPLGWWDGHEQPVALEEILDLADRDGPEAALALAARGSGPHESDPRAALAELRLTPTATALWRWPFTEGVDYLACATRQTSASPEPQGRVADIAAISLNQAAEERGRPTLGFINPLLASRPLVEEASAACSTAGRGTGIRVDLVCIVW
jgi:SAM-dependent methyltransferase